MPKTTACDILKQALIGKKVRFTKLVDGTTMVGETTKIEGVGLDGGYLQLHWKGRYQYENVLIYVSHSFEILPEEVDNV